MFKFRVLILMPVRWPEEEATATDQQRRMDKNGNFEKKKKEERRKIIIWFGIKNHLKPESKRRIGTGIVQIQTMPNPIHNIKASHSK